MNLGSFAGGLAKGYQSQERLRMAEEEAAATRNLRERQIKIAEEDQSFQRMDREQATQMSAELQGLYKSTFGDNPAETMKNDPESFVRFNTGKIALGFKYGKTDPKELSDIAARIKAEAEAKGYTDVFAALSGNPEAKARVLPKIGLDPSKPVQYGYDEKAGRYIASDGAKQVDISMAMRALGWLKAAEDMDAINKQGQEAAKTRADITYKGAATTAQLASAGNSAASAEQTREETKNLRAGLPKDGGASNKKDVPKLIGDALSKSDQYKGLQPADRSAVMEVAKAFAARGLDPNSAALRAEAAYQKASMRAKELGLPPAKILMDAVAQEGKK